VVSFLLRPKVRWLLNPLVLSRGILIAITAVTPLFPHSVLGNGLWIPKLPPALSAFARWDSEYYLTIAASGYGSCICLYAFRPLYPIILHLLYPGFSSQLPVLEAEVVAGFVWNFAVVVLLGIFLQKLTSLLFDEETAKKSLVLLGVYPSTFFLTAVYPEATFLLLVTLTFYYLQKDKVLVSTIFGVLAGFARPEGFLLSIPFLWKMRTSLRNRLGLLVGAVATLLTYPIFALFAFFQTGNPFITIQVELSWGRTTIYKIAWVLANDIGDLYPFFVAFAVTSIGIGCAIYAARKNKLSKLRPYYIWILIALVAFFTVELIWGNITFYKVASVLLNDTEDLFPFFLGFAMMGVGIACALYAARESKLVGLRPYYVWMLIALAVFFFTGDPETWARRTLSMPPILWVQAYCLRGHTRLYWTLTALYATIGILSTILFINWYKVL
jgi:hypothetical protein